MINDKLFGYYELDPFKRKLEVSPEFGDEYKCPKILRTNEFNRRLNTLNMRIKLFNDVKTCKTDEEIFKTLEKYINDDFGRLEAECTQYVYEIKHKKMKIILSDKVKRNAIKQLYKGIMACNTNEEITNFLRSYISDNFEKEDKEKLQYMIAEFLDSKEYIDAKEARYHCEYLRHLIYLICAVFNFYPNFAKTYGEVAEETFESNLQNNLEKEEVRNNMLTF